MPPRIRRPAPVEADQNAFDEALDGKMQQLSEVLGALATAFETFETMLRRRSVKVRAAVALTEGALAWAHTEKGWSLCYEKGEPSAPDRNLLSHAPMMVRFEAAERLDDLVAALIESLALRTRQAEEAVSRVLRLCDKINVLGE